MKLIVAYLRVSTVQQGRSGLGLEAQREAIACFVEAPGYASTGEFLEVETGKGADALDRRPQLGACVAQSSSPSSTGFPATWLSSLASWRSVCPSWWPSWGPTWIPS
jgi:hypothetical protein